jgi:hypothetical protein
MEILDVAIQHMEGIKAVNSEHLQKTFTAGDQERKTFFHSSWNHTQELKVQLHILDAIVTEIDLEIALLSLR